MVLLFIPNEQVYATIHEHDPGLLDEALAHKVVLCSPLTLFAVLAVIRQASESFRLEERSKEIVALLGGFAKQWDAFTDQMEKVQGEAEQQASAARQEQADSSLTPEQRKMLEEQREAAKKSLDDLKKGIREARKQSSEVRENARAMDVPPANIALFRKYETDIKKYAMGGLEWIGL